MEGQRLFNIIYNGQQKYVVTPTKLIVDILREASHAFNISVENYDLCLFTETNIELNQIVFDIYLKDMQLTYDRPFIVKIFQRNDKLKDVSTQTDQFLTFFEEVFTQTDDNYEAAPVFKQDCFIGSLPKKIKLQKEVLKEELECFLKGHFEGQQIINNYNNTPILDKKHRVKLVNIIVSHLVEIHGSYPSAENKTLWAQATALLFPKLCEDQNPDRFEIFYNPANRTGFFAFRLRTINRSLNNSSRKSQSAEILENDDDVSENDEDDNDKHKKWLQQACPKNDHNNIFIIMAKTVNLRKKPFSINEYPRFWDTQGLVDQDFNLRFTNVSFCIDKWNKIKKNTIKLAESKNIKIYDECTEEDDKFDSDITALILLTKFCRTYGKKNNPSIYQFFIFEKTGSFTQHSLDFPHRILRGPSRKILITASIKIDGKEIPLQADSRSIEKFMSLFKCYFVFNCKYPEDMQSFYIFIQEAVLQMGHSSLTPRLKEFKNRLEL